MNRPWNKEKELPQAKIYLQRAHAIAPIVDTQHSVKKAYKLAHQIYVANHPQYRGKSL